MATTSSSTGGGSSAAPPSADSAAGLVSDLMSGKPILSQLSTAMATGDERAVEDVQSKNSYSLTLESVNKVLQGADPGPNFDIRLVAGLYTFQAPADLTSKQMRVDPLSSRLFVDELWVGNSTDAQGHVVFDYSGFSYSLVFSVTYDSNGIPKPFDVSGTRQPTGAPDPMNPPQTLTAKQLVPEPPQPPAEDWTTKPDWLQAATIITIFGGGIPLLLSVIKKAKQKLKEEDEAKKMEFAKQFESMVEESKLVQKRVGEAASAVAMLSQEDTDFRLADHQEDIEGAIETQINTDIGRGGGVDHVDLATVHANAAKAVFETVREAYLEQNGESIIRRFQAFNDVMNADERGRAVERVLDARLGGNRIYADTQSVPWVADVVNKNIAKARADEARERATVAETARNQAQQEVTDAQNERRRVTAEKEAYERQHAGDAERPVDYASHIEELQGQVDQLDTDARLAEARAAEHDREMNRERESERNSEDDQRRANDASEDHAAEAFGRGE